MENLYNAKKITVRKHRLNLYESVSLESVVRINLCPKVAKSATVLNMRVAVFSGCAESGVPLKLKLTVVDWNRRLENKKHSKTGSIR